MRAARVPQPWPRTAVLVARPCRQLPSSQSRIPCRPLTSGISVHQVRAWCGTEGRRRRPAGAMIASRIADSMLAVARSRIRGAHIYAKSWQHSHRSHRGHGGRIGPRRSGAGRGGSSGARDRAGARRPWRPAGSAGHFTIREPGSNRHRAAPRPESNRGHGHRGDPQRRPAARHDQGR